MIAPVAAIPPQLRVRLPARDLREALDGPFAQPPTEADATGPQCQSSPAARRRVAWSAGLISPSGSSGSPRVGAPRGRPGRLPLTACYALDDPRR